MAWPISGFLAVGGENFLCFSEPSFRGRFGTDSLFDPRGDAGDLFSKSTGCGGELAVFGAEIGRLGASSDLREEAFQVLEISGCCAELRS